MLNNIVSKHMCYYIVLVLIIFTLIISCSSTSEKKNGVIVLKVWETYNNQEHDKFLEVIKNFQKYYKKKYNKDIIVKADRVPFDNLINNVKTACLARTNPDIARVDVSKVIELAYHKVIEPINKLRNFDEKSIDEKRKQYVTAAFNSNVIDIKGQTDLYGLPEQTTCLALFRNINIFRKKASALKKAGLDPNRAPKDWDEFIKYAHVLTDKNEKIYAYAMSNSLWFSMPLFNMFKVDIIKTNKEGKKYCNINGKRSVYAFQKKVDFYRKHGIEAGAWQAGSIGPGQGFLNNKYAMILIGPWEIKKYKDAGLNFSVSLIPKPSKREAIELGLLGKNASDKEYNEKITTSTNIGGNNMVIFKNSQYKEEAYEFINYVTGYENQLFWSKELGQIPINIQAYNKVIKDPNITSELRVFMEQIKYAKAPIMVPLYGIFEADIVNLEMEEALKGSKSVQQAFDIAAKKVNDEILAKVNE